MTDTDRFDYLEAIMRARMGHVDVRMSGVRPDTDSEATAYRIELPFTAIASAPTLRDAIDACSKIYPRVRM